MWWSKWIPRLHHKPSVKNNGILQTLEDLFFGDFKPATCSCLQKDDGKGPWPKWLWRCLERRSLGRGLDGPNFLFKSVIRLNHLGSTQKLSSHRKMPSADQLQGKVTFQTSLQQHHLPLKSSQTAVNDEGVPETSASTGPAAPGTLFVA